VPGGCSCKANRSAPPRHLGALIWLVLAADRLTAHLARPLGCHERDQVAAADDAHKPAPGEHRDAPDPPAHQQMPHLVDAGVLGDADHCAGHHVPGGEPGPGEQVVLADQPHDPGGVSATPSLHHRHTAVPRRLAIKETWPELQATRISR